MTYEQLRISRNRAYIDYDLEEDIELKFRKQQVWKSLCLQCDDAYTQEIKGEPVRDLSTIGRMEKED